MENVKGTLPSAEQREIARTIFYDDDNNCNCGKVASQVAMHRDAIGEIQSNQQTVDATHAMVTEIYKCQTGKDPTTAVTKKHILAQTDIYVYMIVGGIIVIGALLAAGVIHIS